MKNKTYWIIGLSVVAVVGGIIWLIKNKKAQGTPIDPESDAKTPPADTTSKTQSGPIRFPLRKGDKGPHIKTLQKYLNGSPICKKKKGLGVRGQERYAFPYPIAVDGDFGRNTEMVLELCYNTKTVKEATFNAMKGTSYAK